MTVRSITRSFTNGTVEGGKVTWTETWQVPDDFDYIDEAVFTYLLKDQPYIGPVKAAERVRDWRAGGV
jgi:hypothetical protein